MADADPTAVPTASNEVEESINSSPFVEPALHRQIAKGKQPVKVPGRRPASSTNPSSAAASGRAKQRSTVTLAWSIRPLREHGKVAVRYPRGVP
jgi:hypothetical protein